MWEAVESRHRDDVKDGEERRVNHLEMAAQRDRRPRLMTGRQGLKAGGKDRWEVEVGIGQPGILIARRGSVECVYRS